MRYLVCLFAGSEMLEMYTYSAKEAYRHALAEKRLGMVEDALIWRIDLENGTAALMAQV